MRSSTFEIAQTAIEDYFDHATKKSYTAKAIEMVLNRYRETWHISAGKSVKSFIKFLREKSYLQQSFVYREGNNDNIALYSWRTVDLFTVLTGLKNNAYYTHYTAMSLNGLTEQLPKVIYLNFEHAPSGQMSRRVILEQANVDKAFANPQRKSGERFGANQSTVVLVNGQYTGRLGVIEHHVGDTRYAYTDTARTLIDIAIRPAYAGGVFEVLKAFENAKNSLAPQQLITYLDQLNHVYPYHQVIGFYLEQAGYSESVLKLFEKEMDINFYLTYHMKKPQFNQRWKLFYPRGMEVIHR